MNESHEATKAQREKEEVETIVVDPAFVASCESSAFSRGRAKSQYSKVALRGYRILSNALDALNLSFQRKNCLIFRCLRGFLVVGWCDCTGDLQGT